MTDQEQADKKVEAKEAHAAFLRWQEVRRTQLGHVVNFVLTLTTATLGFLVSLIVQRKITPGSPGGCAFLFSGVSLLGAVSVGLAAEVSRLWDFRHTCRAARGREMQQRLAAGENLTAAEQVHAQNYEKHSDAADRWGKCTWYLLYTQLMTFSSEFLCSPAVFGTRSGLPSRRSNNRPRCPY